MLDIQICIRGLIPDSPSNERRTQENLSALFTTYFCLRWITAEASFSFHWLALCLPLSQSQIWWYRHIKLLYHVINLLPLGLDKQLLNILCIIDVYIWPDRRHYRCWNPSEKFSLLHIIHIIQLSDYPRAPKPVCTSSTVQGPKQMHLHLSSCIVFLIYHMNIFYCLGRNWWQQRNILLSVKAS